MNTLKSAAIAVVVVVLAGLAVEAAPLFQEVVQKASSCGGFKPETQTLCWKILA